MKTEINKKDYGQSEFSVDGNKRHWVISMYGVVAAHVRFINNTAGYSIRLVEDEEWRCYCDTAAEALKVAERQLGYIPGSTESENDIRRALVNEHRRVDRLLKKQDTLSAKVESLRAQVIQLQDEVSEARYAQ